LVCVDSHGFPDAPGVLVQVWVWDSHFGNSQPATGTSQPASAYFPKKIQRHYCSYLLEFGKLNPLIAILPQQFNSFLVKLKYEPKLYFGRYDYILIISIGIFLFTKLL
jgi:hypothetical protein